MVLLLMSTIIFSVSIVVKQHGFESELPVTYGNYDPFLDKMDYLVEGVQDLL